MALLKKTPLQADIQRIIIRHLFSIVSLVIGTVIALLVYFGEGRDALFLSSVLVLNISIGIFQEVRARLTLEKLRAKLTDKVRIVTDSGELKVISAKELEVGMVIELRRGDVVAIDGVVVDSTGLEVSQAFLTGESAAVTKPTVSDILAGSWVVAGRGRVRVEAVGEKTRNGGMMQLLRHYHVRRTPIERSVTWMMTILTYILLLSIVGLIASQHLNGLSGHAPISAGPASIIIQIAALTATIVPEGLVLAATILFAYAALQLVKHKLLVQHLSAIEMMARVQILCLDKTGTLTSSVLAMQQAQPAPGQKLASLERALASYIMTSEPEGELASATPFVKQARPATIVRAFSSQSGYGEVRLGKDHIRVGTPELISKRLPSGERLWLDAHMDQMTLQGGRVLAISRTNAFGKTTLLGVVSYAQPIKPAAPAVLDFFHERSVAIKIISGDHPKTVRAIAEELKLPHAKSVVSGDDLKGLSRTELQELVSQKHYFARISPAQKAQLIDACRALGTVGMIGDGANDALAIKAADIGLSMFNAAEISRSLADVVLLDNDFAQLPRAVRLADSVITTLELIGCLFLNKIVIGLTLVVIALASQQAYPLTPRNITVLNYFIIGVPILLWTYYPRRRDRSPHEPGYLKRIMPFAIANGLIASCVTGLGYKLAQAGSIDVQMTVFVTTLILGMGLLITAPYALGVQTSRHYISRVGLVAGGSMLVIGVLFAWPAARDFFGLDPIDSSWLGLSLGLGWLGLAIQLITLRPKWIERIRAMISR